MSIDSRLFLIGAMGAGKSAVGRALARLLDFEFADIDLEVEAKAGVDISFIFEKEGETGFRQREHRALINLSEQRNVVIATGGGCVVTEANREVMRDTGTVIYLEASIDQLYERVRCSTHRPLINTEHPRSVLDRIVTTRLPLYAELANLRINTEGRRVHSVAHDIRRKLQQHHKEEQQRIGHT